MAAGALLTRLFHLQATLRVSGDRLGVGAPPGAMTSDLRAAIARHKPELIRLLALADDYRALLRATFATVVTSAGMDAAAVQRFRDVQARFVDELGPVLASVIRDSAAEHWRAETGDCPLCEGACGCARRRPASP